MYVCMQLGTLGSFDVVCMSSLVLHASLSLTRYCSLSLSFVMLSIHSVCMQFVGVF